MAKAADAVLRRSLARWEAPSWLPRHLPNVCGSRETGAIMAWLTNRQRDKWKHRVSNEHAGEGGGPVQMQVLGPKAPPKDVLESWASRYRAAVEKHAPVNAPKAAKLNGDEDER